VNADGTWSAQATLPIPPPEMRRLIGPEDPAEFDNPRGSLVYPHLSPDVYERVLDFGCGCGRIARQLIQQVPRPERYLGIDLHRGMIAWCRANLEPAAPGFEFRHHDVHSVSLNPGVDKPKTLPFPAEDGSFTLVNAWSVFTHLTESQAKHYLREVGRVLAPGGVLNSTWFLFDKRDYPMLTDIQNALYTNEYDLSASVIFDREWVRREARNAGLTIVQVLPPRIRNFQWTVLMAPSGARADEVGFPPDEAPQGAVPASNLPVDANLIGLDERP
jgi:SAM-dependent methyltransferase